MKALTAMIAAALLGVAGARAHEEHQHAPGPGLFGQPPEYVHVLLNPLPVYGLGIGALALGAALLARSKPAQALALGVIVISSASAWPVAHYGTNAYARIREKADVDGQRWLDEHMARADKWIYAFYATALLGVFALASQKKFPKAVLPMAMATLVASGVSLGGGVWIGKAGGQIRHPEFRAKAAPPAEAVPRDHGASETSHERMPPSDSSGGHHLETAPGQTAPPKVAAPHDHGAPAPSPEPMRGESMGPSDSSAGHPHETPLGRGTQKPSLPNTLEGAWKAVHEHHTQLEAAIKGKRFNEVQSHAQSLAELMKQLIALSHPSHQPVVESGVNKVNQALAELGQSAETGSELVMKNNLDTFAKALHELEQEMKKQ